MSLKIGLLVGITVLLLLDVLEALLLFRPGLVLALLLPIELKVYVPGSCGDGKILACELDDLV